MGQVHQRYTRRVNFREGWRGYLWQGRFASFVMDDDHVLSATAYIERNPVKAGRVARTEDRPWSSAAAHAAGRGDAVAEGEWLAERTAGWVCTWGEFLARSDDETAARLRRHESTGRPLGDRSFQESLGVLLGRDLVPRRPGRKRKAPK